MSGGKRPNFLIILADDLGYSDIGCYGGEIKTPNIDWLAKEGLRFSDYHTSPVCSPTRAMLMSGTDCHLSGLGAMAEAIPSDPERFNRPGFEGYLNHDVASLAEVLGDAGYHTLLAGKWHLGYKAPFLPINRGFDKAWGLLPAVGNHFGWDIDWENGERPKVACHPPMLYADGEEKWVPEVNEKSSPDGFYSSTAYVSKLISYFIERTDEESEKPFFAYLPFSAPHCPLQCFPEDRDQYKGVYDDGPAVLRQKRLSALADEGLIDRDVIPHDVIAQAPEWEAMSAQEKRMSARTVECYAGMISCMDREIGKLLDYLKSTGELDNTVIMFFSDNGAEGDEYELKPIMGPNLTATIEKYYDNSYENMGKYNSFAYLGARWGQASTAPNRLYKHHATEGGIRVPMVVRYPPLTSNHGSGICHAFCTVMDVMPTLLELGSAQHPNPDPQLSTEKKAYKTKSGDNRMVYPMRGKSWVPWLQKWQSAATHAMNGASRPGIEDISAIHTETDLPVGWEMHGCASLRFGNWKIVNESPRDAGTGDWQLYDLLKDQGETNDLAKSNPEKLKEMLGHWEVYSQQTGAFLGGPVTRFADKKASITVAERIGGDPRQDQQVWLDMKAGQRIAAIA